MFQAGVSGLEHSFYLKLFYLSGRLLFTLQCQLIFN